MKMTLFKRTWTRIRLCFRTRRSAIALTVLATLAASGCASISAPERSGNLANYEQLTMQGDGTRVWRAAGLSVTSIGLSTDSIVFAASVDISDDQKVEIRTALLEALTRSLTESGVRVVAASEPQALPLRATISEVALATPALNIITTALLLAPLSRGGMSVEIEVLGRAGSGRQAALAFTGKAGVADITTAFSGVGHAKEQARIVAKKLAELLALKS